MQLVFINYSVLVRSSYSPIQAFFYDYYAFNPVLAFNASVSNLLLGVF